LCHHDKSQSFRSWCAFPACCLQLAIPALSPNPFHQHPLHTLTPTPTYQLHAHNYHICARAADPRALFMRGYCIGIANDLFPSMVRPRLQTPHQPSAARNSLPQSRSAQPLAVGVHALWLFARRGEFRLHIA